MDEIEEIEEIEEMEKLQNIDCIEFLHKIDDESIDLILTDPPYIISKDTGMNEHYKNVKNNECTKTEEEWESYKLNLKKPASELKKDKGVGWSKENYIKYGSIYGKKYCVKTDYGEWDSEFTLDYLDKVVEFYYKKLRKGGTCIIWFDVWKISELKNILEKHKFKQLRLIEWVKTNPQPINSNVNYLTNCREIAISAVKGGKPTFNSKYDKGIYEYPMAAGKNRFHPTQKNIKLFEDLIKKHSNENDNVLDTFLGSGTTALACKNTNRICFGCEINPEYYSRFTEFLDKE